MAAVRSAFKYSGAPHDNDPAWRVVIAVGPSRRVEAWIIAAAVAGLAATLSAELPAFAKAAGGFALAAAAVRAARREVWREGAGAVRRLTVDLAGRVEVEGPEGRVVAGRVASDSFVAPWLTIVRWKPEGAWIARTVLVVPDAVEAEAFRRLRVLLRWR